MIWIKHNLWKYLLIIKIYYFACSILLKSFTLSFKNILKAKNIITKLIISIKAYKNIRTIQIIRKYTFFV